jgi:hypothetical protein
MHCPNPYPNVRVGGEVVTSSRKLSDLLGDSLPEFDVRTSVSGCNYSIHFVAHDIKCST